MNPGPFAPTYPGARATRPTPTPSQNNQEATRSTRACCSSGSCLNTRSTTNSLTISVAESLIGRVLCALAGIVLVSVNAIASCYQFDIDWAFKHARTVLVGRVASTKHVRVGSGPADVNTMATLVVERQWKGTRRKTIDVRTCSADETSECVVGVDFRQGERYLVFAYGKKLETSVCDTWQLTGSGDDSERSEGERQLGLLMRKARHAR